LTFSIVKEIAASLPKDSAYFQARERSLAWNFEELTAGERYRLAVNDLSLGWNIARRYARAGRNLPLVVRKYLPSRAFKFLSSGTISDLQMARVQSLWETRGSRLFVMCALADRAVTLSQIAALTEDTPATIWLLARLCFNFRARWNDHSFVTHFMLPGDLRLLPGSDDDGTTPAPSQDEVRLVRLAYSKGLNLVSTALQLPVPGFSTAAGESAQALRDEARDDALAGVLKGRFTPDDNPALKLLEMLSAMEGEKAVQQLADDDAVRGLTGMSLALATGEAATRIFEPDLNRRIELQTGITPVNAGKPGPEPGSDGVAVGTDGFPVALPPAERKSTT
jgi:hypothetical protein